jgi:hypothetical protein
MPVPFAPPISLSQHARSDLPPNFRTKFEGFYF